MIKFYCIYKKDDFISESYLRESIESANRHNIHLTPFPGVYSNIEEHLKSENLFLNDAGSYKKIGRAHV